MTTLTLALCATLFSGCLFSILCLSDDKRYRRTTRPLVLSPASRAKLAWLSVAAPLLTLCALGAYAATVCWLGMLGLLGWAIAARPVVGRGEAL